MYKTSYALTASQTVGPFFHDALIRDDIVITNLAGPDTAGQRIRIEGRVLDGDGQAVPDAMLEIWQANAAGRYNHPSDTRHNLPLDPSFVGFGRSSTAEDGGFWFETIKPGRVPFANDSMQAPHISFSVFGRGLLNHLYTRLYFADEHDTEADPILQRVPPDRRGTLISQPAQHDGIIVYHFDIVLQGAGETAFLNFILGAS